MRIDAHTHWAAGRGGETVKRDKKDWHVSFSWNGWECSGGMTITAVSVKRDETSNKAVFADGVRIEMDEEIGEIRS